MILIIMLFYVKTCFLDHILPSIKIRRNKKVSAALVMTQENMKFQLDLFCFFFFNFKIATIILIYLPLKIQHIKINTSYSKFIKKNQQFVLLRKKTKLKYKEKYLPSKFKIFIFRKLYAKS